MMSKTYRKITIIPAYNEVGKIGKVIGKIPSGIVDEVVVIDDCSQDDTVKEAKKAGAIVISHTKNMGVGAAIRTGIDYAITNGFQVVSILSGDDQHDPCELRGLLEPITNDDFDFVQGSRRIGGLNAPEIGWFRRTFTWMYAFVFRLLTGFPCTDATNGGRAFKTSIFQDKSINLWQEWLNTYELEPYLLYKVVRRDFKVTEAPMKVIYHRRGTTKMKPFRDWWRIFRPMIYLALGLRN
jgi:dolichol-phosphate mannosyltransferase